MFYQSSSNLFTYIFYIYLLSSTYCLEKKDQTDDVLPPCQACKSIVNSFKNGMLKTNTSHFGGGDMDWEERKLGNYSASETRLVEIQEHLCSDVGKGQKQCYSLAEEWEGLLEDWWFKYQNSEPDIYKWLCISNARHCCPELHYGTNCTPCHGFPDKVCNNNGRCKGSGTRKGNGECVCNEGYVGLFCTECAHNYYVSYKDDNKLLCSKCHQSCKGGCHSSGNKGCTDCNPGWIFKENVGCVDIDECLAENVCKSNQFCVNNDGSFSCLECDPSCESCFGDGPDMCKKCSTGYTLKDRLCLPDQGWSERTADLTRYGTYFGLCAATCIIFQKNTVVASLIGLFVAIYVSLSEYILFTTLNPKKDSIEM